MRQRHRHRNEGDRELPGLEKNDVDIELVNESSASSYFPRNAHKGVAAAKQGLEQLGAKVTIQPVAGYWPVGSKEERRRLAGLLMAGTSEGVQAGAPTGVPANTVTIVDGLVASGAPEAMEAAAAGGHAPWVLLHMPLDEHPDLEARALRAAAGVICTSGSTTRVM